VSRKEFRQLFERALQLAAQNAEQRSPGVPRAFLIELHGAQSPGLVMSVDEAFDRLYLGDDRFYRIIDVMVKEVRPRESVVFVRASDHPPAEFDKTWDPSALGPFKQLVAEHVGRRE
jgi:hypothetical protein